MTINSTNDIARAHQEDLEYQRWRDEMEDGVLGDDWPYEPEPPVQRDEYTEWARNAADVVNWAKFLIGAHRGYGAYDPRWLNLNRRELSGFSIDRVWQRKAH